MAKKSREKVFRGDRMKEAREALGYRVRADYAEASGIDERQIKRYENGEGEPSGILLTVICETLNVSMEWLFGLTNDPRRNAADLPYAPTPRDLAVLAAAERKDLNELARIITKRDPPNKGKSPRTTKSDPKVKGSSG